MMYLLFSRISLYILVFGLLGIFSPEPCRNRANNRTVNETQTYGTSSKPGCVSEQSKQKADCISVGDVALPDINVCIRLRDMGP